MHPFTLERPRDLPAALALRAQAGRNDAPAEYIAGGTDMVQLLQEYVRRPERLVSLAGLLDDRIDGELLRYAARFGLLAHKDDQIDVHDRYAIRAGFWREVEARSSAERALVSE